MEQEKSNHQTTIVIIGGQKSAGVSLLLTILFGPLGLLYSSVIGGVVMIIASIIIGFITLGFGLIVTWIGSVIWGVIAVNSHNEKLLENK